VLARFSLDDVTSAPFLEALNARFGRPPGPLDSYGCFWLRRPYICYHMVLRENGHEWVTRFDVVSDVQLAADEVRYTDLLLDAWFWQGELSWEDEDDVAAAVRSGLLDAPALAGIDRARSVLTRRHRAVVREVRRLAGLG
jgi:hypothetical protein